MSLTRLFGIFLGVLSVTDAFAEFEHSRLYDEKDFDGHHITHLNNYCAEGCYIYVSVPDNSTAVSKKIYVYVSNEKATDLFDVDTNDDDGLKKPFILKPESASQSMYFVNVNAGLKAAPILVWIVKAGAPNIDANEVYDAVTFRSAAPASIITIIDAEPFVVTLGTDGPAFPFEAITAGFDALGANDKCTRMIQQSDESYQDLIDVRSPLITFVFNSGETKVQLTASKNNSGRKVSYALNKVTFATSPGYIGCSVKEGEITEKFGGQYSKTFRSSAYDAHTEYYISNDEPVSVVISADLNTDKAHAVMLDADGKQQLEWYGVNAAPTLKLAAKELYISWTRNDADLDQYFLVRVVPDRGTEEPVNTTTLEPEIKQTTTFHPKSTTTYVDQISTTTLTTVAQTTSGASYDTPLLLSIILVSAIIR